MAKLGPRKLMEQAIEVMRHSVSEPRADGKVNPLVGAALWKPDGTVETACRGELRDGDHAEYALLERKSRAQKLDGAVLFATLEPCAPGSRRHLKLGCAERIVLARIKEVWIGIEDPDPTVDRKGIKYLQDSGVMVHMFDRDLQEEIRKANKVFIEQALVRAAAARTDKTPKAITLSPLENAFVNADTKDFSPEALNQYRTIAKISETVGSPAFNRRLVQQGLLKQENGRSTPTGFGLLLFGSEPRTVMPQAGLLGTIHFADRSEEPKDFDGPQVLAPEQALQWLRDKLPNPIERSAARRREGNEALFELVREGVVNALVHRDYSIGGTDITLAIYADRLEIQSPGRLPNTVTPESMKAGMRYARNQTLVNVMRDYRYVDFRGMGVKDKIIPGMLAHNGTEPELMIEESRFTIRLWKEPKPV